MKAACFPGAMQRAALLRRTGTVPDAGAPYGPGSAAHRFAKSCALRCVRGTSQIRRPARSQYGSRSRRLKILPESSRGSSRRTSMCLGTL